ncbi:MAG: ABC transporter ATP-binding protein [Chloroflexi bacterium]|nr:ABC transporter ATP-binding protein [Chloroflexota bacterium]
MPVGFERPKDARKTLGRLLAYLKNRRLMLVLVFFLMLISAFSGLAGNYFLKPLINDYILPGNFSGLLNALVGLGGIYLLGVIAAYLQSRIMVQVAQKTTNLMRRDLFVKMQSLPLKYFDTHTHGDLMSRFTNDLDNVQMAMEQSLVQLASSALTFVGAVIMMLVLSPLLFLVTFLVLALMFFLSGKLARKSSKFFKAQQQNLGDVNGYVEEMVDGLKVIKVFNHEENAISEFKKRNEAYRQAATEANFYAGVVMPVMGNLNNIAYAATALFGGILTVVSSFDIGSLAAFLQYSRMVGFPVIQITNQFNALLAAMAGAERVFNVMDQAAEVDNGDVTLVGVNKGADGSLSVNTNGDRPSHWAWKVPQADGSVQYVELKGDVRFHEVNFGYEPEKTVLRQLSLYAKPGQKIALVGSTGAGKTTITNLLNRFYDVEEGSITYDGIDIKRICKDDLRQSLGMVLQDTHLFSGTILDNIRYGRLDATDEECVQAAKQVNAHSFIKRLPQGYHTQITADGTHLSQGQRQLLAITRAAIADPPVMILDEATSSIDTRTERLIEKGMDALMEDRTVFVIAHRLSTVRNARAILVLENGEIIERGDHADLLEQKGRYYQLYTGQYELS